MKKLDITKKDFVLLALFITGLTLLLAGVLFKSLWMTAGVAGLVIAWFLSIDNIISNHRMHLVKLIVFSSIILFLPLFFAFYLSA